MYYDYDLLIYHYVFFTANLTMVTIRFYLFLNRVMFNNFQIIFSESKIK